MKNKIIVITGGAGTLGQSFVEMILSKGSIAIVADKEFNAAEFVASRFSNNAIPWHLDITSEESISKLIAMLLQRFGRIDALVNNAYPRNINYGHKLDEVTYIDFCENVSAHLGGYFLMMQQFCIAFEKQKKGVVINMSSIYGSIAPKFEIYAGTKMTMPVEYAAIKAGIEHLTRYFAQYYKGKGIRVNSLSPGGILAGQPDSFLDSYNQHCASKGMLSPSDLCGALEFLLSDASMHMNGQNIIIDDGFSL